MYTIYPESRATREERRRKRERWRTITTTSSPEWKTMRCATDLHKPIQWFAMFSHFHFNSYAFDNILYMYETHSTTNIYPYVFVPNGCGIFIVKQHTKPKSFRNSNSNNTNNNNDEVRSFFSHSFFIFSVAHFSILCVCVCIVYRWAGLKNCGVWAIMEFTNIEHLLNTVLCCYGWVNAQNICRVFRMICGCCEFLYKRRKK